MPAAAPFLIPPADELTPEQRALYEAAMQRVVQICEGVPSRVHALMTGPGQLVFAAAVGQAVAEARVAAERAVLEYLASIQAAPTGLH